jgi:hypothetical protein
MARGISLLLLLSTVVQASIASAEPQKYSRQTYLFASVDVPAGATQQQPDVFVVRHKGLQTIIQVDASTPHYDDRGFTCGRGRLTYKLDRPRIFAFSCAGGPDILYEVYKYGKTYRVGASDATEQIGFSITYPASQKRYWDPWSRI